MDKSPKRWTQGHTIPEHQGAPPDAKEGERLQKYLARSGVASRRQAEHLIASGAVAVNGVIVREMGTRVLSTDTITVNGQTVQPVEKFTTVAIHKPVGYVSTARDPQGRPIVADLLPTGLRALRLVPVGRLDLDSEGLLLLSNDGELALRLTHPRYEAEKEYHALIAGELSEPDLERLRRGVVLPGDDPRPTAPAQVWRLKRPAPPGHQWYAVTLREGRKRQVRLMFSVVGARVERLMRVRIGHLWLRDVVPEPGTWRTLSAEEIARASQ